MSPKVSSHAAAAVVAQFESPDPTVFIIFCAVFAMCWAAYNYKIIAQTTLDDNNLDRSAERASLKNGHQSNARQMEVLREVYQCIQDGARSFLRAEYTICFQFVVAFSVLILVLIGW